MKTNIKTKPKKLNIFKTIVLGLIIILLGLVAWIGYTAIKSAKEVTNDAGGGNSIFSLLRKELAPVKGQAEGRTNILLLGMGGKSHPGGGLTDTIIVLSINWKTKKLAMISVPRDLWVKIPSYGYSKLNAAYYYSEQNSKVTGGGGKATSEVINKVLGIPIHYYVTIDFDGFKKIIDSIGGVDVYVSKAINDPFYPAADMIRYDPFKIAVGQHHMNGEIALKYARSRETTSDFDRSRRQEEILLATKNKILSLNTLANPKKVADLLGAIGDHLRTSLSIAEIKTVFEAINGLDTEHIINKVFDTAPGSPLQSAQEEGKGYYILPRKGFENYTDLHKIAQNIFDLPNAPSAAVKLEIYNGTDQTGAATKLANQLKKYGYQIVKAENAVKDYPQSIIYNCGGSKTQAATSEIASIIKAKQEDKVDCGLGDIQLIIGENSL